VVQSCVLWKYLKLQNHVPRLLVSVMLMTEWWQGKSYEINGTKNFYPEPLYLLHTTLVMRPKLGSSSWDVYTIDFTWRQNPCTSQIQVLLPSFNRHSFGCRMSAYCVERETALYWRWLSSGMLRRGFIYLFFSLFNDAFSVSQTI
jgi:hypothetical protein